MDIDLQKIQEAYSVMTTPITEDSEMAIASGPYVREARPQDKNKILDDAFDFLDSAEKQLSVAGETDLAIELQKFSMKVLDRKQRKTTNEAFNDFTKQQSSEDSEMAIASGPYVREARPQDKTIDKAIRVDDTNVTHEYSDQELHQMAIVALTDMLWTTRFSDSVNISSRKKVEWLIRMLQKRAQHE